MTAGAECCLDEALPPDFRLVEAFPTCLKSNLLGGNCMPRLGITSTVTLAQPYYQYFKTHLSDPLSVRNSPNPGRRLPACEPCAFIIEKLAT
jgi:hypothetical protein